MTAGERLACTLEYHLATPSDWSNRRVSPRHNDVICLQLQLMMVNDDVSVCMCSIVAGSTVTGWLQHVLMSMTFIANSLNLSYHVSSSSAYRSTNTIWSYFHISSSSSIIVVIMILFFIIFRTFYYAYFYYLFRYFIFYTNQYFICLYCFWHRLSARVCVVCQMPSKDHPFTHHDNRDAIYGMKVSIAL